MSQLEPHLGGHGNKTHLDNGALQWLQQTLNATSYLDIGCGPGGMVQLASELGFKALGIDGDYTLDRYDTTKFIIHDFTTGPIKLENKFDLGWSVEFVEHVYEQYIPNYMPLFEKGNLAVVSAAPPGWPGHHHVNCREASYWVDVFKNYGLRFNKQLTDEFKSLSQMRKNFFKRAGMVFLK